MKIPNIKLGFSNKRYTHNLSRDCNTTFPFGIVQPILTQYLLPNSDIRVNAKQLVRLAPMPVPSFARVSLHTVTRFVPEHDVVPYSDAFYSRTSYRGQIPSSLPYIDNPTLVAYLLCNSNLTVYRFGVETEDWRSATPLKYSEAPIKTTPFANMFDTKKIGSFKGIFDYLDIPELQYVDFDSALRPMPTPESADYVVRVVDSSTAAVQYLFCFSFGTRAKTFRNICLGLGYSLDMDDFSKVRFSPLLSYYKAYYDTYGLTRFKNFTQTKCFKLISEEIDAKLTTAFSFSDAKLSSTLKSLFAFFDELVDSYYSAQQDFVSIHRTNVETYPVRTDYGVIHSSDSVRNIYAHPDNYPVIDTKTNGFLTTVSLRALSSLSRFVSKNSILGQRLTDYMSLHYGADSVSSIFQDSNFVDSSVLPCQINDVFSTSDTAQYDSSGNRQGELLGSFAGKGIGFGDLSFHYSSKCHGYIITLASVVPDAGYWQGNAYDMFALSWEQQPSADFDALGMEATPRSAFISHNDISNRVDLNTDDLTDKTFGFVPRFSGFKFAKNVVNGDMSRRGSIDSLSPYYLDHIVTSNQLYAKLKDGKIGVNIKSTAVPSTSYDWRYVAKYPWLGNFLRMFVNDTGQLVKGSYLPSELETYLYPYYCLDDPFLCQVAFKVNVTNCLKPLSLSYDTFNEDVDNSTKDVNPS